MVRNVRENHFSNHVTLGHLVAILIRTDNKFKAPETVFRKSKVATYGRPFRVTEKPELLREEKAVHLIRCISKFPQRKFRMGFRGRESNMPVQCDPCFFVGGPIYNIVSIIIYECMLADSYS